MVPYSRYSDLEDTSKLISENFDKKNKKMLTWVRTHVFLCANRSNAILGQLAASSNKTGN